MLELELAAGGVLVDEGSRLLLAVAVREHGTGGPWRLFSGQVLALATCEWGWP